MLFVIYLAKVYIIILLFRAVATPQELYFNSVAKVVGMLTPMCKTGKIAPLYIFLLVAITSVLYSISSSGLSFLDLRNAIIYYMQFFLQVLTVSMLLGSFGNRPAIAGGFISFFFRLGLPWVKLARVFFPINSGAIIIPAIIILYLIYVAFGFILGIVINVILYQEMGNAITLIISIIASGLYAIFSLLYFATFLMIIRALLSWFSPDPRNILVQFLYTITEPLLLPFRKIIPPIGFLDLSALVAILAYGFVGQLLMNLTSRYNLLF